MNIKDRGLEALVEGLRGKESNIASLNLKNNGFSRNGYSYIKQVIFNSRLLELNVSDNRLGNFGITELEVLKMSEIHKLNLSNTDMESEGLCNLLFIIKDCKSVANVILDRNNFSHNWFRRIEESVTNNRSLKSLSLSGCSIKHMDSLFRALFDNHILQKLDISCNNITEHLDELADLLKRNNTLK